MHTFAFSADPLAEATSLVAKLSLETPEDFMRHLRACEAGSGHDYVTKFDYKESMGDHDRFRELVPKYFDYFCTLASSIKLSDEQKLQAPLVMVPYFMCLKNGSQENKDKVVQEVTKKINYHNYTVGRLLLAALCYTGANMNDKGFLCLPASWALLWSDYSLLEKLLCVGVDPNCNRICLARVETVQMADLLLKYGADIYQQHQKEDLIDYLCSYLGRDADPRLIALYLNYIPLDETNGFGKKWFNSLARSSKDLSKDLIIRIKSLLPFGCHYDEQEIENIINKDFLLDDGKKETFKKIFHDAFDQDKKKKQNLVRGLHNRQITGRRMHSAKVNMHSVRERAMIFHDELRQEVEEPESLWGIIVRCWRIVAEGPEAVAAREERIRASAWQVALIDGDDSMLDELL
ncbi:MAG: hypothetical protein WD055_01160 [Candidatus Dependentiae bacterium]